MDGDTIDVIALTRLLQANRWLIGGVTALFGAAAIVLALISTEVYRAETVVTPALDSNLGGVSSTLSGRLGGLASLAGIDLAKGGPGAQQSQAVLESRRLVEEFVRRNGLAATLLPPGKDQTVWNAVQRFRDSVLTINRDDVEGTTNVAIEWKDPAVAAAWANGLVALCNELMRAKALADSQRNIEYLRKQVEATSVLEMQRVMYELIQSETKTLMLANARADFAFTVVDPAVAPEKRFKPKRKLMVASGLAIGFVLASLFVFGRDTVRRYRAREAAGEHARS